MNARQGGPCWQVVDFSLNLNPFSFFILYLLLAQCCWAHVKYSLSFLFLAERSHSVSCYDKGSRLDALHSRDAPLHTLLVTIGYLSYRCLLISSGVWSFFPLFWHQKSIFHPENSYFFLLKNTIAAHSYTEPVQCSVYGLFNKSEIHNSGSKG